LAEIACKTRHFVSVKQFNVHSKVELGPFEKITFLPPDPLMMMMMIMVMMMTMTMTIRKVTRNFIPIGGQRREWK